MSTYHWCRRGAALHIALGGFHQGVRVPSAWQTLCMEDRACQRCALLGADVSQQACRKLSGGAHLPVRCWFH